MGGLAGVKVRAPFLISWGYAGPRGGPCRVRATLYVLRDPFRQYRTWSKAEPYQMATEPCTIFNGIKDGDRFIPNRITSLRQAVGAGKP